jgi:hypothetical protein
MKAVGTAKVKHSSWLQYSVELLDDDRIVEDVLEDLEADDLIERPFLGGELVEVALLELKSVRIGAAKVDKKVSGFRKLPGIDVHSHDPSPGSVGKPREISIATPGVQHVARPGFPKAPKQRSVSGVKVQSGIEEGAEKV